MDVAVFSDTEAHALGVDVRRLRLVLFMLAGLLTAGSVLLAGPIGFVGLICPHLVRLAIGPRHRALIAGSALAGAALMIAADTMVKLLASPQVASWLGTSNQGLLPIGVLTAMIGGPLFLWMLRPHLGRGGAG